MVLQVGHFLSLSAHYFSVPTERTTCTEEIENCGRSCHLSELSPVSFTSFVFVSDPYSIFLW